MPDTPAPRGSAIPLAERCKTCSGIGWASQWRTYGHQEMHGYYYEKCDDCEGTGLAAARDERKTHDA